MNGISKFIGSSVVAVAFVVAAGQVSAVNVLTNPGFETGTTASWIVTGAGPGASVTVLSPDNGPTLPGSFNAFQSNTVQASNLALSQTSPNGSVGAGVVVNYSFDLKSGPNAAGGVEFVHIFDENSAGAVLGQPTGLLGPFLVGTPDGNWHTFTGSFTTLANTDHLAIEFDASTGATTGSIEEMHVDNVILNVPAVPEPTTVTLVGLGLFGAIALGRKRKS